MNSDVQMFGVRPSGRRASLSGDKQPWLTSIWTVTLSSVFCLPLPASLPFQLFPAQRPALGVPGHSVRGQPAPATLSPQEPLK